MSLTTVEEMEQRSAASVITAFPLDIISQILACYAGVVADLHDLRKAGNCLI